MIIPGLEWKAIPLSDYELKHTLGATYKLLDGGMTCPNRDGTCGSRGCIFCSEVDPRLCRAFRRRCMETD